MRFQRVCLIQQQTECWLAAGLTAIHRSVETPYRNFCLFLLLSRSPMPHWLSDARRDWPKAGLGVISACCGHFGIVSCVHKFCAIDIVRGRRGCVSAGKVE